MRHLSKSRLIAFRQCPKRLWLEIHRPDLRDDSNTEAVFRVGHEVGEIAREVYDPEGVGTFVDVGELGFPEAFRLSAERLESGGGAVFEAGLRIDGVLAFADVMLPAVSHGKTAWRMLEVKSTTSVKDYHRDDLAIQTYLADCTGVRLESAAIAHIDNRFVYPGDGHYEGLFTEVDLTEEVRSRRGEVALWIEEAHAAAALAEAPAIAMGSQCSDPFACPFADHCSSGLPRPDYPLSSLPKLNGRRRAELEALGIEDLREVPDEFLTETQRRVKEVTLSGEAWLDAAGAAAALAPYGFPARFLDFETVMMPVPVWPGTRPYQQIPFQYSLHRRDGDGTLHHEAFLDPGGDDPSEPLAEALIAACGADGPVFAYNAAFERRVIRELAGRFPALSGPLLAIAGRMVDLLPIARACFYAPGQHGSWSLKAVLPAICPDLSYDTLAGVADGEMAVNAYREAIAAETTPERRAEIERQLLEYCHLDTLALVRLWEVFRGEGCSA